MKILITILSVLAITLIAFNITKLNFDALLEGDSFTALVTIVVGLCALIMLQILRISKKIESLQNKK